ncbi:MAG: helix-turn-helix domain-containing protein [Nitrospirales bacterium]|nr:helix-turn-helix domain-containing protein [Nitrospirales bacterium]
MKKKKQTTIVDEIALSKLTVAHTLDNSQFKPGDWIRLLRTSLRMTQAELAKRARITQANLVAIETGKVDPRVGTLQRIYQGLFCHLSFEPRLQQPLEGILRNRARVVALQRLKTTMGTMALEEQAPDKEIFTKLLEKQTEGILRDPRERLWRTDHDG